MSMMSCSSVLLLKLQQMFDFTPEPALVQAVHVLDQVKNQVKIIVLILTTYGTQLTGVIHFKDSFHQQMIWEIQGYIISMAHLNVKLMTKILQCLHWSRNDRPSNRRKSYHAVMQYTCMEINIPTIHFIIGFECNKGSTSSKLVKTSWVFLAENFKKLLIWPKNYQSDVFFMSNSICDKFSPSKWFCDFSQKCRNCLRTPWLLDLKFVLKSTQDMMTKHFINHVCCNSSDD